MISIYVIIKVLAILDIPSFLLKKAKTKKLGFKLTEHLFINYNQFFFYISENLDL